ncbi:MAG: SDR family oxidoreductase [Gammaproteobacteria bacterium]|nr:SDR family oxidoreductase [Gammaproteobacteria bacterium]
MDLGLRGKNAVITGATRGIGRAIADALAAEGVNVAFCARNAAQVAATENSLRQLGVNVFGSCVDVGDGDALRTWIAASGQRLGGIDILIANPSAFGIGNSEDDWKKSYDVDLMGVVRAVEAATPFLEQAAEKTGDAALVVLSSVLAAETDSESAYGAMKAGLIQYTKGVSRRLAPKNVRANLISPGTVYVEDGFWANAQQHLPQVYEQYLKRNPMGRMACPKEIAKTAVFLASPASSFTTGSNIVIDGAFTGRVNY